MATFANDGGTALTVLVRAIFFLILIFRFYFFEGGSRCLREIVRGEGLPS